MPKFFCHTTCYIGRTYYEHGKIYEADAIPAKDYFEPLEKAVLPSEPEKSPMTMSAMTKASAKRQAGLTLD